MFLRFLFVLSLIVIPFQAHAGDIFDDIYGAHMYDIDKEETRILFVTKMCTADIIKGEFHDFSGKIYFDKAEPENSWVDVTIDASSLWLDHEYHKDELLKDIIEGDQILKTEVFPKITLKSTSIEVTSIHTGIMTADMTLVGETHPITLEVTFENAMTDRYATKIDSDKIAFSAYGTFKRSDWNILYALDRIGIRRMVDDVQILLTTKATLSDDQTVMRMQ